MEFKKYRHIASWRSRAYPYLAEKQDLKESSIRSAASRAGLTSKAASLNHIFSVKEEEALVEVCIRQARQYRPFTIPEFCKVAREFAGSLHKRRKLSRKFVCGFVKRHRKVLHTKKGKITSPKRSTSNTLSKTQVFVASVYRNVRRFRMNSKNLLSLTKLSLVTALPYHS